MNWDSMKLAACFTQSCWHLAIEGFGWSRLELHLWTCVNAKHAPVVDLDASQSYQSAEVELSGRRPLLTGSLLVAASALARWPDLQNIKNFTIIDSYFRLDAVIQYVKHFDVDRILIWWFHAQAEKSVDMSNQIGNSAYGIRGLQGLFTCCAVCHMVIYFRQGATGARHGVYNRFVHTRMSGPAERSRNANNLIWAEVLWHKGRKRAHASHWLPGEGTMVFS